MIRIIIICVYAGCLAIGAFTASGYAFYPSQTNMMKEKSI